VTTAGLDPRIERVSKAIETRDAGAVVAEFTDDGVFLGTATDETFTGVELREYLAVRVFTALPDYSITETNARTMCDLATVVEYTFQATHEGPLGGALPTGNTVRLPSSPSSLSRRMASRRGGIRWIVDGSPSSSNWGDTPGPVGCSRRLSRNTIRRPY
jgi:hypothetical protein